MSRRPVRLLLIGRNSVPFFVFALAGGLKVIVDELVGPPLQWQIPRLLAPAGDLEMRHAAPCVA